MRGEIRIHRENRSNHPKIKRTIWHFTGDLTFKNTEEMLEYVGSNPIKRELMVCQKCGQIEMSVLYNVVIFKLQKAGLLDKKYKRICCYCANGLKPHYDRSRAPCGRILARAPPE